MRGRGEATASSAWEAWYLELSKHGLKELEE